MIIPNDPLYVQAFRGVLADLGKYWTWSRTVGQSDEPAQTAAEMWRDRLQFITISEECDDPVSCADVTDCIETNGGTQEAIRQIVSSPSGQQIVYNTTVVGTPMAEAQRNAVVATSEDCNPDSLFGSVTSIIDQLHRNNQDFLEIILLSDNEQQRISKVIKAVPLLNEVPIDEALDFVSQMTSEIKENYEAEYTDALRDTYRCDIFCMVKDVPGCEVSFQMLVEYFNDRVGTTFEPINFFNALVQYFTTGTWSGTLVVDIMTLIQLSAWQQASDWTGISLRTLQTVGLLGANDPDPDWEIICEDCATPDDLWIRLYPYGSVTQNSGPTDGSNGHYSFTFTSEQVSSAEDQWWSWWVWRNKSKKLVVTSITNNQFAEGVPNGARGSFGTYIPGNGADEISPLLGVTFTMPMTAGEYGGFWCTTYATYPNTYTVAFDLEDIV